MAERPGGTSDDDWRDDPRHFWWCQQEDCVLLPGPGLERDDRRRGVHRSHRRTLTHTAGEQLTVRMIAIVREPRPEFEVVLEAEATATAGSSGNRIMLSFDAGEAFMLARQLRGAAAVAGSLSDSAEANRRTARLGQQCPCCGAWLDGGWDAPRDGGL